MTSNLKVNNILPSTGTTVAVSGIASVTSSVSIASSCTATTFYGSGANLTSLPSQLTLSNNADNRIITGGSGVNLNGEAELTYTSGALKNSGAGYRYMTIGSTNAQGAALGLDGDSNGDGAGGDYAYIQHDSSGNFNIVANNPAGNSNLILHSGAGAETLRITSDGKVGIQTNAPSDAFLDIASSQPTDSLRMRRISSDSNVASNWSMKPYGGHLYFREGGSTDKIQFMNGGDLFILDGNLRVASGHGIDFNATSDHGSATPASELLDDYEEGSWTPVLESTSTNPTISSYSKQQGLYTKIGNVVHLFCFIDIAAGNIGGTLTGDGKITGLPFVISNNPSSTDIHGSACDNLKSIPNTFSAQRNNAMLYFPPGQNYLAIHQYNTTNPIYQTGWGMSQIGNGNRFKWAWTGQYRTDQI